jgi:trehalose 6-phosphate synthase/phosphatase
MSRLIIISSRLPYSIYKTEDEITLRQSSGGLVSALKSYFENQKIKKINTLKKYGLAVSMLQLKTGKQQEQMQMKTTISK